MLLLAASGIVLPLLLHLSHFSIASNATASSSSFSHFAVNSSPPLPPPHSADDHHGGVRVASFKLDYVKAELILALFIFVIGLFKLCKNANFYKFIKKFIKKN